MTAAIGLVDCNNFYASCEQAFNPALCHRPVIVLSNNDGNIIARSREAKAIGLKMGEPVFKARPLIEKYDVQVFSSNYELYGDMSARVMEILSDFSPAVEVYSIDEAFIRMEAFVSLDPAHGGSLPDQGRAIMERIRRWTGIPVSVGIATSKTLAKVANHFAKRSEKTRGCLDLTNSPWLNVALERLPVEEVWGIGPRYAELLLSHGIGNARQLRDAPDDWIRERMSVVGLRTVHELRGIQCLPLETTAATRKSVTVSRSFGDYVESLDDLRAAVAFYVSRAAEKLRREKLAAGQLTVFIQTSSFSAEPQYNNSATLEIAPKTDATPELRELAFRGLAAIFREGYRYKRAGVLLNDLVPIDTLTLPLWGQEESERMKRLMTTVDELNGKFGRDAVRCGLFALKGRWSTRIGQRSPRYTTRWNELMQAG
ncbi:MAG: Y-family DNA polymerase [Blastocatellia bacterium]